MEMVRADNMAARWEGFANLPAVRQLGLMIGLAASVALGVAIVLWAKEPSYGVLFGALADKEASEVMEVLQQKKIDYKVDNQSGAVMVPSARLHEIRLELAKEGLPKSSNQGLEFLNKQQEFGTSQFIQNARYQHALEQELANSVTTISAVQSARVHLALPKQSVFVRERRKPSASVLLNLYGGRNLEDGQVSAIAHLVASSIPELEPGQVTVVDQRGRLLSDKDRSASMAANEDQFEYTRRVEDKYVQRIEDILAPIVGLEGVRARVTAEMDFTVTEQTQETYNPDLPALRSEQISEQTNYGGVPQGVPGALSNQPPGEASVPEQATAQGDEAAKGEALNSRRSSTTNYELDRTISHTKLASGVVKRLSIAVVLDDRLVPGEGEQEGTLVREAWPQQELDRLTSLVREAVGYDARRGDTVNVMNASFTTQQIADIPEPPVWKQAWVQDYAKLGLGVIAVLILIFGVLRPVLRNLTRVGLPARGSSAEEGREESDIDDDRVSLSSDKGQAVKLPGPGAYEDNIALVRDVTREDPKLVANVVKTWVDND